MPETWFPPLGQEDPLGREWLPTPVFLPGESQGQRSLVGHSPWGHKELDRLSNTFTFCTFILNKDSVMSKRRQDLRMRVSWRMQCSPRGVLEKQFKVHWEQEGKALECQARKHWLYSVDNEKWCLQGREGSRRNILSRLMLEHAGKHFDLGNIFLLLKIPVSQLSLHYKIWLLLMLYWTENFY